MDARPTTRPEPCPELRASLPFKGSLARSFAGRAAVSGSRDATTHSDEQFRSRQASGL